MISEVKIKNICAEVFFHFLGWDKQCLFQGKNCRYNEIPFRWHRLTMRKDAESFYYLRKKYGSSIAEVASIRRDILRQLRCSETW